MALTKKFNLDFSRKTFSAYGYALYRLIVLESSWITDFPEYANKVAIGLGIGKTSDALEASAKRLREQVMVNPSFVTLSKDVAEIFDAGAAEKNLDAKQGFIISASSALLESMKANKGHFCEVFDAPSLIALDTMILRLQEKMEMLNSYWAIEADDFPDMLRSDGGSFEYTGDVQGVTLLDTPARPENLTQSDVSSLNAPVSTLLDSIDGQRRFVHFIYADIEIAAAEICARNIALFSKDMPLQFTYDMARQCADEARHAVMADKVLSSLGGRLGDYTYKNHIWAACEKGDGLAERLAIEQIVGEGNGLDTTEMSMSLFKEKGLEDLLRYYEFLQADETIHCAFGNRWIRYLVDGDENKFNAIIDTAISKTGIGVPGVAPVCIPVRRAAEFSEEFINSRLLRMI